MFINFHQLSADVSQLFKRVLNIAASRYRRRFISHEEGNIVKRDMRRICKGKYHEEGYEEDMQRAYHEEGYEEDMQRIMQRDMQRNMQRNMLRDIY